MISFPKNLTKEEKEKLQSEIESLGWNGVFEKLIEKGWKTKSTIMLTNLVFSGLWKNDIFGTVEK